MSETLVVVQARMGSSRLPGKVALPLCGAPLLVRMLQRVRAASTPFSLCVATSTLSADDEVVAMARQAGVPVFRGDAHDCLGRHLGAAHAFGARVVVKVPSDCPLIDPAAIDAVLSAFSAAGGAWDFASNLHPPTWPDGNDVEAMSVEALEIADREAMLALEREHTTPFFWEQPARFRLGNVRRHGLDLSRTHRFTIDYPEDYRFVRAVFEALYREDQPPFGLQEILELLASRPEIVALNARWAGVNWYRHHLDELRTVGAADTRADVA
jgi:spore coat polysaccharide biosynthesis protein SpsF